MPAEQLREVRRRIRSVQSTKKITRAMELIAASRIVKAQQRVAAARPYSEEIARVVANLVAGGVGDHPLLQAPEETRRVGLVVLAADRGLAGAYNVNVLRMAEGHLREVGGTPSGSRLFLVGRKAQSYFRYRGYEIHRTYAGMSDTPTYEDARRVAGDVLAAYWAGEIDAVEVVYTRFQSAVTQRPVVRRLLPVQRFEAEEAGGKTPRAAFEFEPGEPEALLDRLLPRYVEAELFAAMLDASASEHAARRRAMQSATENADDLIRTLKRVANRARQAEITTEITEIVGGAEALRRSVKSEEEKSHAGRAAHSRTGALQG